MTEAGRRWDEHAAWWQREFTDGADPEYEDQIVPLVMDRLGARSRILDVGTGEGQLARALRAGGGSVTGIDPSRTQLGEAVRRRCGPSYVQADCSQLPVRGGSCDGVVVCLVLEHVDDLDGAIAEVVRVLEPGGTFLLLVNHPLLQTPGSGMIVDHVLDPPETYWRIGPYLPETETVEEVHKGVFVRFLHRPLGRYVNCLIDAGLRLMRVVEPAPPDRFIAKAPEYEHDVVRTTPRLMVLEAMKPLDTLQRT